MPAHESEEKEEPENPGTEATAKKYAVFTKEMYKKQIEIFENWTKILKKNIPDPEESKILTNIVMEHWKGMSSKIEEYFPDTIQPGPELVDKQREFYLEFIESYNEMMKELMATSAFAANMGAAMTRAMEQRGQMEDMRDDFARAMGFPTRKDIREIHESLYFLNKRFDDLERILKKSMEKKEE